MVERAVFLERSWADIGGAVGFFHYAVNVCDDHDDDWYELEGGGVGSGGFSGSRSGSKRIAINGYLVGHPKSGASRSRINPSLKLAGCTYKNNQEILNFNQKWMRENQIYDAVIKNCQKYASELIQYLVGPSFKMDMPFTSSNSFSYGAGSHEVSKDGYYQKRVTTGKDGSQWGYFACEVEGPSAGADSSDFYVGAEASLVRVEAQVLGFGARLEPNINTGLGFTDGQFKAKAFGFGFTVWKGFAIHTPFGSLGFGWF